MTREARTCAGVIDRHLHVGRSPRRDFIKFDEAGRRFARFTERL